MVEKIDHSEIAEFIRAVNKGIKEGSEAHEFDLQSSVEFEIAVIVTKKAGFSISLAILDGDARIEKGAISKIRFKLGNSMTREIENL